MADLIFLKQKRSVDSYHDSFESVLNQLRLSYEKQMMRLSIMGKELGPCSIVMATKAQATLNVSGSSLQPNSQLFLDEFTEFFQELHLQLQDHKISLIDEQQVVKVKPCRYLAVQKTEMGEND